MKGEGYENNNCGVGKVGSTLARQLSASGYDITLIDVKQQVLEIKRRKI